MAIGGLIKVGGRGTKGENSTFGNREKSSNANWPRLCSKAGHIGTWFSVWRDSLFEDRELITCLSFPYRESRKHGKGFLFWLSWNYQIRHQYKETCNDRFSHLYLHTPMYSAKVFCYPSSENLSSSYNFKIPWPFLTYKNGTDELVSGSGIQAQT